MRLTRYEHEWALTDAMRQKRERKREKERKKQRRREKIRDLFGGHEDRG